MPQRIQQAPNERLAPARGRGLRHTQNTLGRTLFPVGGDRAAAVAQGMDRRAERRRCLTNGYRYQKRKPPIAEGDADVNPSLAARPR